MQVNLCINSQCVWEYATQIDSEVIQFPVNSIISPSLIKLLKGVMEE